MDQPQLTPDALRKLTEADDSSSHQPILQVLSVKKITSANAGTDRYRLIVSDGEFFMQAMMATSQNEFITSSPPSIEKNTIIRLAEYAVNVIQNRRVIICLNVEPLMTAEDKIGNPTAIDNAPSLNPAKEKEDVTMADPASEKEEKPKVNQQGRGGSNASSTVAAKKNGGAGGRGGMTQGGAPIYPIEGLSPYQNKWTIKARVTTRSEIKHWSNARGDGKLFSVNLLDDTGEIKATGFNDACDNLYPLLEEGKVFYITKARVNIAKKQFSNLSNEYEITFEKGTEVTLCEDQDEKAAPKVKYSFVDLGSLSSLEKDATCDVLGIVKDNGSLSEITSKASQKQIKKRELSIVDQSGYSVRLTLWGRTAETWNEENENGLYAFKGAKVGDFGGRTLSMGGQSTMAADPDIPEAHSLRGWYDTEGSGMTFQTYSSSGGGAMGPTTFKKDEFKTLEAVREGNIGMEQPEYFSTRATVVVIRSENLSYPACPTEKCNKKMSMESDDVWRCEKCDKTYARPEYRYVLSLCVSDHTGQLWLSGFNEVGLQFLGKSADEMQQLKEEDEGAYSRAIAEACAKTYNFGVRAKADTYQDQTKIRYHVTKAASVDWVEGMKGMLKDIEAYGPM